jgi:Zn finger protein HypA/HybF involved in hydrogenase expression
VSSLLNFYFTYFKNWTKEDFLDGNLILCYDKNKRYKMAKNLEELTSTNAVKNRIIKENLLEYKCDKCDIDEWLGNIITLHLDHIDGNNKNNTLSNLRFLCPNCHSQTDTYCGRNKNGGKRISNTIIDDDSLIEIMRNEKTPFDVFKNTGLGISKFNYDRVYKLALENSIPHMQKGNSSVPFTNEEVYLIYYKLNGSLAGTARHFDQNSRQVVGRKIAQHCLDSNIPLPKNVAYWSNTCQS